jgi:glycosyltransferase involved in cell wall biosynthesis
MITTIITTYKRPLLLKRAVKSVLNQTYPNFKVCVYDNASNDETEEIMRDFLKMDSRIEYYKHQENIGMMANYSFGYSRINTPYFSFLSDDDYFLPWFYETALEGFKKHPDAAFSACGVLAVDGNYNVVADPISGWKKEGYFSVPEGIYEMISSKCKIPPPQGVLFQRHVIKDVNPEWSKEIQVMWDPDYLIQIAARYPIVISKKISSIFLAHDSAFSTGFYKGILKSAKVLEDYLIATNKLIQRVLENPQIPKKIKNKIKKTYVKSLRNEIGRYMEYFITGHNVTESYCCAKILFKNSLGINFKILKLLIETFGIEKFPRITIKTQKLFSKINKFKLWQNKSKPSANWNTFHEYKDYVESISR